jgi:hypothetical protein
MNEMRLEMHSMNANTLVRLQTNFAYVFVSTHLNTVGYDVYSSVPTHALVFYSETPPVEAGNVEMQDGKTLHFPGTMVSLKGIRGTTEMLTFDVTEPTDRLSPEYIIENISFYPNFHIITNEVRSEGTLVFGTVPPRFDYTMLLDYATNDATSGTLRAENVLVPLPSTDMQAKQLWVEVYENEIAYYFKDTPETVTVVPAAESPAQEVRLDTVRAHSWTRFRFYNLAWFTGFLYSGTEEQLGADNVLIGFEAGEQTQDGSRNVCLGNRAGRLNQGSFNLMLGDQAGHDVVSSDQSVCVGHLSGSNGSQNVYLGHGTGSTETLHNNIWIGPNLRGEEHHTLKIGNLILGDMANLSTQVHGLSTDRFTDGTCTIQHGNIENVLSVQGQHAQFQQTDTLVANVEHVFANVANVAYLHTAKGNVAHLQANVANVAHLQANVANVEHVFANVANVAYLHTAKGNVDHLQANVANVEHVFANVATFKHEVRAPKFTDGHLTITNGNITGISSIELADSQIFFENGKLKFRYQNKTYIIQSEES